MVNKKSLVKVLASGVTVATLMSGCLGSKVPINQVNFPKKNGILYAIDSDKSIEKISYQKKDGSFEYSISGYVSPSEIENNGDISTAAQYKDVLSDFKNSTPLCKVSTCPEELKGLSYTISSQRRIGSIFDTIELYRNRDGDNGGSSGGLGGSSSSGGSSDGSPDNGG